MPLKVIADFRLFFDRSARGLLFAFALSLGGGALPPVYCAEAELTDRASIDLARSYQMALTVYTMHRQLYQRNLAQAAAASGSSGYSLADSLLRLQDEPRPDLKMPPIQVADNSPFIEAAQRDFEITRMQVSLKQLLPALLAIRFKISRSEYEATWKDLMDRVLKVEQAVIDQDHRLSSLHASTNSSITDMIHAAERDCDQKEYLSTYRTFKETGGISNLLFAHADKHAKLTLDLKNTLLANPPDGMDSRTALISVISPGLLPAINRPTAASPNLAGPPDDPSFSEKSLPEQEKQLDREYQMVNSLFLRLK